MPLPIDAISELAALLLAAPDISSRAALIASAVVEALPDCACVVHRLVVEDNEAAWTAVGAAGEISVEQTELGTGSRLMEPLLSAPLETLIYSDAGMQREDYAHLHVTRSVASIAYLPLLQDEVLVGVLEILSFSSGLDEPEMDALGSIAAVAPAALLAAEESEQQRQNLLDSVHRLTQLYDLEKTLNATLELDEVIALIPEKTAAILECQSMHLWLFDGDVLRLMSSSGFDPTVEPRMIQAVGEGYVADMAEEGEPLLLVKGDERLELRNAGLGDEEQPVTGALLVPLLQDEAEIGVLEAINKADGSDFDEDDQFFLSSMAETVSSSLKNASLMFAERKLQILEALVRVSSEITSTLRLDRLLQIIVNSPQNVLPYERCSIALDHRGRLQLKSISGLSSIPLGDAQVEPLHVLLRWLSNESAPLHIRWRGEGAENAEIPDAIAHHFEATGYRAIYSLPLNDDQGRVGLLLYEAHDPDFLDLPQIEMIKILAAQTTVAIRNALLYREVPLISLLEPLMQRKQALLQTSQSRRLAYVGAAITLALILMFIPLPMRVTGEAVIAPQHLVTVAAPVDGIVAAVHAHEGQRVAAGQVLGAMNDWQWRMDLASAEAKYQSAQLIMQSDLAHGAAAAGTDRAQAEYLRSELARARSRLDNAQLRSPIDGIVVTPALQNAAGEHLDAGAQFAQVLDLSSAVVDVSIRQSEVALLKPGESVAVKLDSYPQRSWHGSVSVVSPQAQPGEGERYFAARVPLPNDGAMLRAGMTGRAKIFIGYRPSGYVLLRGPALWLWQTLWNWIGW